MRVGGVDQKMYGAVKVRGGKVAVGGILWPVVMEDRKSKLCTDVPAVFLTKEGAEAYVIQRGGRLSAATTVEG